MSRPKKCRIIDICLDHNKFVSNSWKDNNVMIISWEELQAIKLKDIDKLSCISGAEKMWIWKSTFANIYNNAHEKIAKALIEWYDIKFKC